MPRPSLSIRLIEPQTVQVTACVGLESVHDFLGTILGFDDGMNVIGSRVRGQETPALVGTDLAHSLENDCAANLVEHVGRLIHLFELHRGTLGTGFRQPTSRHIVVPVD
jgi:hypothetical protein